MQSVESGLIDRLKKGDEEAFRDLVEQYQDRIYNTCLGFVKNTQDADDIAQEVFIEVYTSINSFKGKSKLSTWIYRIAVNKSLEHIRKTKRKKRYGIFNRFFTPETGNDLQIPDFDHPGIAVENSEKARILFWAIDKLPENQKIAFTLHKLEDLSYEQISEVMNRSLSSVESLLHRAKNNLKKYLHDYYYNSA